MGVVFDRVTFEFLVTSPFYSVTSWSEAGVFPGAASQAPLRSGSTIPMMESVMNLVGYCLVVETYGSWGQEAVKCFAYTHFSSRDLYRVFP